MEYVSMMDTESEELERLRRAFDLSGEGLWELLDVDPREGFTDATAGHFGRSLYALLGRAEVPPLTAASWTEATHPDDRERVQAERLRQLEVPGSLEERRYRVLVDGAPRWLYERMQVSSAGHPGRVRVLGVVRDITVVEQARLAALRRADLLIQTQAAASVGGWELDMLTGELSWTAETRRIHEVPPGFVPVVEEAIRFYAPEHVPVISAAVEGCQRGEPFDVELDLITYTGKRIHVHATGHPYYEDGRLTRIYGAFRDITEARRREDALREQIELTARQERAIRAMSTPILQVWDEVLALPVIGAIDAERAAQMMDRLLTAVVNSRARCAILDLTGVDGIDMTTAEQLLCMTRGVGLLGARARLCGVTPAVAQTLSELGVDMSPILAFSNLQAALADCLRELVKYPSGTALRRPSIAR